MVKIKIVIVAILLSIISIKAQNIDIKASTDSTNYTVGDYINYKLRVIKDKDISVDFTGVKDSVKGLEFIKEFPKVVIDETDEQIVEEHIFVFSKYDSSEVLIPSYTLECFAKGSNKSFRTKVNDVYVSVSTYDVDESKDIIDIKRPIRIPFNWIIVLLILLSLLIISAIVYYILRKRKSNRYEDKMIIEVKIPPYKIALKELNRLEEKKLWQAGKIKEYHTEITNIIRKYIEDEFRIPALESTSSELINEINKYDMFDEVKNVLKEFLTNADMVKFAKFEPNPTINEKMMQEAYDIIYKTHKELAEGVEENAK